MGATKRTWFKKSVIGLAAAVLMATGLNLKQVHAYEGDILDQGKASVPKSTDTISNKYGVIAQYTPGVTERIITGTSTQKSSKDAPGSSRDLIVAPSDSKKGEIKALYTNVGTYKGRDLDFELVAADWQRAGFPGGEWFMFYDTHIGFTQSGYDYVDLRGTYKYHDTGKPATDMPGSYMTVNDLDANQFMSFDSEMTSRIDKIYTYTDQTRISYWKSGGYTNIGAQFYDDIADTDEKGIMTLLVSGYTFNFRWSKDWNKPASTGKYYNKSKSINWYAEQYSQYFGYIAKKPARSEMLEPAKVVVKADGSRVDKNSVNAGSSYTYGIVHTVPDEYTEFYYSKYIIEDSVDPMLDITKTKVVDSSNNDVTDRFDLDVSGPNVTATAKSSWLNNPDFYKKTYTVLITVKTPNWQDAEKYANGNHTFGITNTAYVTVDKDRKATNPVPTTIIMPWDVTVKHVHKKSGKLLAKETVKRFDGEGYAFSPRYDLKNDDGYSYIPRDDNDVTGTVNGGDVTVYIYYDLPIGDYGIKRIEVYTKPNDDPTGLITNVTLDPKWIEDFTPAERDEALIDKKITLTITDTTKNEVALTKSFTLLALSDYTIKTAIPVKKSGITPYGNAEKRMYSYKLTSSDPYIVARKATLDLNGYTSSRKRVFDAGEKAAYTGPVMVEREMGKAQKVNLERIVANVPRPAPMKTGYGIPFKADVHYDNDINTIPHQPYKTDFYVDPLLMDSYINDAAKGGYAKASVETTASGDNKNLTKMPMTGVVSKEGNGNMTDFLLPKTYVEAPTGYLFTEAQRAANDSRITGTFGDQDKPEKDATTRRLYVPTWLETLKPYQYVFKSQDEALGANLVSFTVANQVDIEAYMYSHTDSKTQDKDELLLMPKVTNDTEDPSLAAWLKDLN